MWRQQIIRIFWMFRLSLINSSRYDSVLQARMEYLRKTRSATRKATRLYQFITINQASFQLWWKYNLVKHRKFSWYCDHRCGLSSLTLFASCLKLLVIFEIFTLSYSCNQPCYFHTSFANFLFIINYFTIMNLT